MTLLLASRSRFPDLAHRLRQREAELHGLLHAAAGTAMAGDNPPDVLDFKDVAAQESRAVVDEVAYAHAAGELSRVLAALRRIDDGTYGTCEDCGEAIDQRRLQAMPATRFCTACQAIHERPAMPRR